MWPARIFLRSDLQRTNQKTFWIEWLICVCVGFRLTPILNGHRYHKFKVVASIFHFEKVLRKSEHPFSTDIDSTNLKLLLRFSTSKKYFEKVIGPFQISDSKKGFIKFDVALQKNEITGTLKLILRLPDISRRAR